MCILGAKKGHIQAQTWPSAHGGPLCQGRRMKSCLGSTQNPHFFYWPILWYTSRRIRQCKESKNLTTQNIFIACAVLRSAHLLIRNMKKTFARISILSAPINRTTQRVKQIYLQIKKLIFLEIGCPGWACFKVRLSSPGLDICTRRWGSAGCIPAAALGGVCVRRAYSTYTRCGAG